MLLSKCHMAVVIAEVAAYASKPVRLSQAFATSLPKAMPLPPRDLARALRSSPPVDRAPFFIGARIRTYVLFSSTTLSPCPLTTRIK